MLCLVGDAGVCLDPVQVAGHTGEASRGTGLTTSARHEGGDTDELTVADQDQWAAGVAVAGGHFVGGSNADHVVGGYQRAISVLALRDGHNLEDFVLQSVSDAGGGIGGLAPSGGNSLLSSVSGVGTGDGGQLNLVNKGGEGNRWGLDQGNVVPQHNRVVAGVLNEVIGGNGLDQLGTSTHGGSVVDGHSGGTERYTLKFNSFCR